MKPLRENREINQRERQTEEDVGVCGGEGQTDIGDGGLEGDTFLLDELQSTEFRGRQCRQ